jgi:putative oxidoreductase
MRGFLPHTWSGPLMSLMRVVFGLVIFMHGTQKFFGWPAPFPMEFELMSKFGIAAVLETVGGALMMLGLFTRPVAFVLSGEMAVTYFIMHVPNGGIWPLNNGGEAPVLLCFAFLFFAAAGPGTMALDKPQMDTSKH